MKRSFLHALALTFCLGFSAGIFLMLTGALIGGIIISFLCMLIAFGLLNAAERAPERKSSVLRFAGWLAGIAIGFVLLALIVVL